MGLCIHSTTSKSSYGSLLGLCIDTNVLIECSHVSEVSFLFKVIAVC